MSLLEIVSSQNQHYKWLKSLTQKKFRDREGLMILEGERLVYHGIQMGFSPSAVFVRFGSVEEDRHSLAERGIRVFSLAENLFDSVSDTVHSQGIIAVFKKDVWDSKGQNSRNLVILDQIQDPGNLGTIIRTCDALGLSDIYMTKGSVDPYSQKVLRATMGSIFNVKLRTNVGIEIIEGLKAAGMCLACTALEDSVSLTSLEALAGERPLALCFGNEGKGISKELLDICDFRVKIPMRGGAESLNVAVAAGIVLYQVQSKVLE